MSILFNKQKSVPTTQPNDPDGFSSWYKDKYRVFLGRIVMSLSKKEQQMSVSQKKAALAIFILLMGCISLGLLCQGLFDGHPQSPEYLKSNAIVHPGPPLPADSLLLFRPRGSAKRFLP